MLCTTASVVGFSPVTKITLFISNYSNILLDIKLQKCHPEMAGLSTGKA